MSKPSGIAELRRLATLYGIQTAYYDVDHRRQAASVESLLSVLQGLGAPVAATRDAPQAMCELSQTRWRRPLEPVTVAWEGKLPGLRARVPRSVAGSAWECVLTLESGETRAWQSAGADLPDLEDAEVEGEQFVIKLLPLPQELPEGYHRLTLKVPGLPESATQVISAPIRAYDPFAETRERAWGVFLPLYALRSQRRGYPWGDFADLQALAGWVGGLGGGIVATLPLLAGFSDEPFDPSPYAPVSRLMWNEFYLDVTQAAELAGCADARDLLASVSYGEELERLGRAPLVDYRRGMALKREALEALARHCFSGQAGRSDALHRFLAENPAAQDYARFRAVMEKQAGKQKSGVEQSGDNRSAAWRSWPQRLRDGDIRADDYDEEAGSYHSYVQWLCHEQVRGLSEKAREQDVELYLDLPLGVHPDGYDVWRNQDLFAGNVAVGAPPDAFFTRGQNWGFPPIDPEKQRDSGYAYYKAYLRHHFQAAGLLRIDHVMGLHRLFWVPEGMETSQGAYVRYPAEELYAILTLESHRNQAAVVGEDLGTVPAYVRSTMRRHGIYGMYVTYFNMTDNPKSPLRRVSANALASVNTHDMPPFAAFWQGLDIRQRAELGHQSKEGAEQELAGRDALNSALREFLRSSDLFEGPGTGSGTDSGNGPSEDLQSILEALLVWLGRSRAPMVLANLEDLWLETQAQNMPGTGPELPNWRRKARYSMEEFSRMRPVLEALQRLDRSRKISP